LSRKKCTQPQKSFLKGYIIPPHLREKPRRPSEFRRYPKLDDYGERIHTMQIKKILSIVAGVGVLLALAGSLLQLVDMRNESAELRTARRF
jgi:hypothetical protein